MDSVVRWFLPIYLTVYLATAFLWRSYVVWRRTGINPYALRRTDSAYDFIGVLFRLVLAADMLVVALYVLSDTLYSYLTPLLWLQSPVVMWIGIALLVISLLWVIVAQAQMGNSWRIGIDTKHETQLVQQGVFRITRNPIFLGMRLTQLGLFLVLPNAITFALFILGDALIQIQVRLEEEHLAHLHGEQYQVYRQQTRRWL